MLQAVEKKNIKRRFSDHHDALSRRFLQKGVCFFHRTVKPSESAINSVVVGFQVLEG